MEEIRGALGNVSERRERCENEKPTSAIFRKYANYVARTLQIQL